MMRAISLLLVLCFLALPVSAAGVINPSTESQSYWCRFYYTKWICNLGDNGGIGGTGPQGIPGINGTGGGDINYFNFSGSNLTTISNITNFFNYTSIFSEMNQTPGEQGIPGINGTTPVFGVDYFNGTDGENGIAATIAVNNTITLAAGNPATVTNIGSSNAASLDFGIPAGAKGDTGDPGTNGTSTTLSINYTFTGLAGTEANVTNVGNATDALWDITVPQGMQGEQGEPGATGGTGGQVLFYHHDPVESPAGYEGLFPTPAGSTEDDENVTVKTGTGQVLVDPYITPAGYPGITTIPAGLWRFRTFHYVDSAPGNTNAVFKVYNRSGTTETLLFTATSEDINSLVVKEYLTSYVQTLPYTVALTDRIVIKVYGQSDHSSNIIFHFVYEGSLHTSHVQTPLETSSSLYIRHDGTVNFTGKQSMGGYNLTNLLDPVAAQDAATRNYVDTVNATGITDHGVLSGLTDDDHVRYFDKDGSKYYTGTTIKRNVNDSILQFWAGDGSAGCGAVFTLSGKDRIGSNGKFAISVPNAAKDNFVEVFRVNGATDTPFLDMESHRIAAVLDPTSVQDAATKNYVDTKQKCGATATVADGGIITHTFGTTPTYVLTTGTVANNVIDVTAKGSTNFTVSVKLGNTGAAGTTQTVYWCVG